ncbi:muconolactone Delta-isomerase family protein [bacterium]|nr:muconolactone Delta-isomerase family protein [bacterium]
MNEYMFHIDLPDALNQEFLSKIPAQREKINKLMGEGVISSYTLAKDRTRLWVTVKAESEDEAYDVFESFPLYDFMDGELIPLMFHQSINVALPQMSMN